MVESKSSPRYPYTYAYDLLRETMIAGSRADCAEFLRTRPGMTPEKQRLLCEKLADFYVRRANEQAEMEARHKRELASVLHESFPSGSLA